MGQAILADRWDSALASSMAPVSALAYRSRLLAADRRIVNWGGGNTSSKAEGTDHRGRTRPVLWVKGSGADLAAVQEKGFAALYLDDLLPLLQRTEMSDADMVDYLSRSAAQSAQPRSSIETLLHAFLPFRHVDHTHPDSIISVACCPRGPDVAREIFGNRFVWAPYIRPGFSLSKQIGEAVAARPDTELVIMEKHGLITWGEEQSGTYRNTLATIQRAADYIERVSAGKPAFGGAACAPLAPAARRELAAALAPLLRGLVSQQRRMLLNFCDDADVLEFVGSAQGAALSQVGAACPDHLVHTKRTPLWVDWAPGRSPAALEVALAEGLSRYAAEYRAYQAANRAPGDPEGDPFPRVILIPGLGMFTTGKSWQMADVAAQLYHRAIAVMRGATALEGFVSLSPAESYAVEYWPLELYKLTLAPPEAELSRQVAVVTGGAGGIGRSTCELLIEAGAHVVVLDINAAGAERTAADLNAKHGAGRAAAAVADVTQETSVAAAYAVAALTYGGVDIVVSNAGLASSAPVTTTSLAEWNKNMAVLATGYFLVSREAMRLLERQNLGGSIVFVASKNALVAGKNAAAYSAAKAAELHLARCLAEEGGARGIRVNTVCPDAILDTQIWSSTWREERAAAYGIAPEQLEAFYRQRTTLKVNVLARDVAEAIIYFASPRSAKTTGCVLTVDGGVPAAYTR